MFIPLLHRILVKPEKFEDFSKDIQYAKRIGLVVAETEEKKRAEASVDRGEVVAIGATAFKDFGVDCPIKIGDIVNYARYSGKHLEDANSEEKYILLNDEDVLSLIKS